MARACLFLLKTYEGGGEYFNLGNGGQEISIAEVAKVVKQVVGFQGELVFDTTKPDGMKRKVIDSSKLMKLGWRPTDSFLESVKELYRYYQSVV